MAFTKTKILLGGLCILLLNAWSPNRVATKEKEDWKIYTDSECGFSFEFPSSWPIANDSLKLQLGGGPGGATYFYDSLSKTLLLIGCNLTQAAKSWDFEVSNFDSSCKWITIDGQKAIERIFIDKRDGRGNLLRRAEWAKSIDLNFLNKKQTGEIALKFVARLTHYNNEVKKFNRLLSSFKFSN